MSFHSRLSLYELDEVWLLNMLCSWPVMAPALINSVLHGNIARRVLVPAMARGGKEHSPLRALTWSRKVERAGHL